jgi:hypothetical protein
MQSSVSQTFGNCGPLRISYFLPQTTWPLGPPPCILNSSTRQRSIANFIPLGHFTHKMSPWVEECMDPELVWVLWRELLSQPGTRLQLFSPYQIIWLIDWLINPTFMCVCMCVCVHVHMRVILIIWLRRNYIILNACPTGRSLFYY